MEHTAVERELIGKGAVKLAVDTVLSRKCTYADEAAMALRNLTRSEQGTKALLACEVPGPLGVIPTLADAFCRGPAFNENATLHHLAHVRVFPTFGL